MNADDGLSFDGFGPVERCDGIIEGSHLADVCTKPIIPDPLDDRTQLGAIGHDDEVNSRPPAGRASVGPRLGHDRRIWQR